MPGEPRQLLKLFQLFVGDLPLESAAPLASTVALGVWLPRALADLYALLLNVMRPENAALIHRDEILDAWGLGYEARQDRLTAERSKTTETSFRF